MSPKREMSLPGNIVLRNCPVHQVPEQLGFCVDGNANPCGEFGERCIRLSEKVLQLAAADVRGLRNMASLTRAILSDVRAENGRPCGLLSFTDPS